MTRVPRPRDSATFSAASRQTEQRMNRVSPSFHSLLWRSNARGVEATVKLATAAPDGVNRSSGSPVMLPMTVMTVSPAMASPPRWGGSGGRGSGAGAQQLGPQHRLVESELTVELLGRGRLRRHGDDGVDALGLLLDLVGQPTAAPDVDVVDAAAVLGDDGEELVERRGDRPLVELGVEDDHEFVLTHALTHLLWSRRSRHFRDRRVVCVPPRPTLARATDRGRRSSTGDLHRGEPAKTTGAPVRSRNRGGPSAEPDDEPVGFAAPGAGELVALVVAPRTVHHGSLLVVDGGPGESQLPGEGEQPEDSAQPNHEEHG